MTRTCTPCRNGSPWGIEPLSSLEGCVLADRRMRRRSQAISLLELSTRDHSVHKGFLFIAAHRLNEVPKSSAGSATNSNPAHARQTAMYGMQPDLRSAGDDPRRSIRPQLASGTVKRLPHAILCPVMTEVLQVMRI